MKNAIQKNGKCNQFDCFANGYGICRALKRDCVEAGCGFYKNIAVWAAENEITMKKLQDRKRDDLILLYKDTLTDLGIM